MTFYSDMQQIASDLLTDFDQSKGTGKPNDGLWYIKVTPGTGPAHNPGPAKETTHKLNGASRGVKAKYINGALIVSSDMQATVMVNPAIDPLAANLGFIRVDGKRHKVKRIDAIPPSGETVAYRLFYGT